MPASRILRLTCSLVLSVLPSFAQHSAVKSIVSLTPAMVESGSPELIVISTLNAKSVSGLWLGHKLEFFHQGEKWIALAGVDVETPPGITIAKITR